MSDEKISAQRNCQMPVEQMKAIVAINEPASPTCPRASRRYSTIPADAKLTSEMGKIFDKSTGKAQLADEQKTVPSVQPGDSLDSAFEKTWDHLHSTEDPESHDSRRAQAG